MPSTAFCGTQSAYVDDTESKAFGAMFELLTGEGGGGGGLGLDGEGGGLGSSIGGLVKPGTVHHGGLGGGFGVFNAVESQKGRNC